jgi:spore maturation protein CgeB
LIKKENKLQILLFIKPFWKDLAKHKSKSDFFKTLEKYASVHYWYRDGNIHEILNQISIKPDFILHYDIAHNYTLSPNISGLNRISIPKGCYVIDPDHSPAIRRKYIHENNIDIVFSVTKENFLKTYPELKQKFVWLPWSVNQSVFKDWNLEKDYNYLLMGLVQPNKKRSYDFREKILEKMINYPGFKYHKHPGHLVSWEGNPIVDTRYAQEINRSKIFFTCGSSLKYPVLKFFEGPACNSLLLAEANKDIRDLGFKDGVNFVECTTENVEEKAKYFIKNENLRKKITLNGYNFIHKYHSNDYRARQLVSYINKLIVEKKFNF